MFNVSNNDFIAAFALQMAAERSALAAKRAARGAMVPSLEQI